MRDALARGMHEVVLPFSGGTTFLFRGMLWGLRQIFVQPFNAVGIQIFEIKLDENDLCVRLS